MGKVIDIIELMKTGDFTIAYHDNGHCFIYKGKIDDYDDLPEDELYDFARETEGYLPLEVEWLVMALGGKTHSI